MDEKGNTEMYMNLVLWKNYPGLQRDRWFFNNYIDVDKELLVLSWNRPSSVFTGTLFPIYGLVWPRLESCV